MTDLESTASFGYWVRRQRLALDLTQADLARRIGCAAVTVSKIERDERRPSLQMAALLADNLAIPDCERQHFLAVARGERAAARMPMATQPLDALLGARDQGTRSALPTPATPFVGRQKELEQLAHRLAEPECRLLTLAGPGGFGKTRLAIRLAEIVLAEGVSFPDGTFFVSLERLENPHQVVPAIATAVGFDFYERKNRQNQLLNYLAGKRLLLVLDNAETILDGRLVSEIISRAPGVKILVTSRETLNIQEEWFHPLSGMAREGQGSGDRTHTQSDASQLFYQCARRARPGFDLDREASHVRKICELVEGAPLAVELAAAWLRSLSCAQVAQELERSLDFLSTTMQNVPHRHQSMRYVLEQSWNYLTAEEQRVFRQLSVFVGGFRGDAAEQIADASLRTVASLVEKSMIQLEPSGRYRVHVLLRQLGAEKLAAEPEELASTQGQHCAYFTDLMADYGRSIAGAQQKDILQQVEEEWGNLRAAWGQGIRQGQFEALERALPCLVRYLWTRGNYEEGEHLTGMAVDALDPQTLDDDQQRLRISLAARRAQFAATSGDYLVAQTMVDAAMDGARRLGYEAGEALCNYVAGMIAEQAGEGSRALEFQNTALSIYENLGDLIGIAESSIMLGYSAFAQQGNLETFKTQVGTALRLFRDRDDLSSTAFVLDSIALVLFVEGEIEEAERHYLQSLQIARDVGNPFVEAKAIGGLGIVAAARDQWDIAVRLLEERLGRMQDLGHENEVLVSLNLLCLVYVNARRFHEAVVLIKANPGMWQTHWTAQAHIGAGSCQEAMRYLPQETETKLVIGDTYDLARCLVAWAMLLMGDCELVVDDGASASEESLTREQRIAMAGDILTFLGTCDLCEFMTRKHARALLGELQMHQVRGDDHGSRGMEAMSALAQEVLSIRLG